MDKLKKFFSVALDVIKNPSFGLLMLCLFTWLFPDHDKNQFAEAASAVAIIYTAMNYDEMQRLKKEVREQKKVKKAIRFSLDEIAYNRINTKKAQ